MILSLFAGLRAAVPFLVGAAVTLAGFSLYDALVDDPAVRASAETQLRADALAEANRRITTMLENNDEFLSMGPCARYNELARDSGLPIDPCDD